MSDEIIFCETPEDVAEAAAELIFEKQTEAVAERGVFRIALSVGSTPKLLYQQLASEEWREEMSWEKWEVYWSDERAVPPDHPESNYHLAYSTFLSKVPVRNVFPMLSPSVYGGTKGGLLMEEVRIKKSFEQAARDYSQLLPGRFDLILLGVGSDGHTASLFPREKTTTPQSPTGGHESSLVAAVSVNHPIPYRLTLTYRVLNAALSIIFLITGEEKARAIKEILELGNRDLPATLVNPPDGECFWILDEDAACLLE